MSAQANVEQPKEGSKQHWYAKIGYLLAFVLLVDLVALGPIAYHKSRPMIARYIEEKCSEKGMMGGEALCSLLNKYVQLGNHVEDSSWSTRAMNGTNSTENSSSSSGNGTEGNSSSGNSSSGNSSSTENEMAVVPSFGSLTLALEESSDGELSCESLGCTSATSLNFCALLACNSGTTQVTATTISEEVQAGTTSITLADISGMSVGDLLVILQQDSTASYTITSLGRRLLSKRVQPSGARRLAGVGVNPAVNPAIKKGAIAAAKKGSVATTTTHDDSAWWPSWAYWLLFIGIGLCLAAIAAIAAMACMGKKKAPKKRALKPPAPAPPVTTTMPVTTTAVPMTYAQPATTATMMYAQQPSYTYAQPFATAQPMTTATMAAPSFTTYPY